MADERRLQLISAISELSNSLHRMIEEGWKDYQESKDINDFTRSRGPDQLHGLLRIYPVQQYAQCFKAAGVRSKAELETAWNQFPEDKRVQDCVENLLAAEDSYVELIEKLDKIMNDHEEEMALPVVTKGGHLSTDINVIEANSGDSISLSSVLRKNKYTLFILRKHYV